MRDVGELPGSSKPRIKSQCTGRKSPQIGILPGEWDVVALGDITEPSAPIRYGVVQIGADTPDGVPIVPIKFINKIETSALQRAAKAIEGRYAGSRVTGGDILLSVKGTIGRVGVVPEGFHGNIAREIARIRLRKSVNRDFIALQLEAPQTQRRIGNSTVGSTRLEFSIAEVRDFLVALPPINEQRKIAEILRTWDAAIEKLGALRAAKEKRTSAIADDLIFGVRRAAGYRKPWVPRRLAEVTRELTRRNRDEAIGRDLVMGVTNSRGIVPMREQTIAADISRYLILPPRAFAYNPMRINVGSIAMSQFEHDVLVSPDYVLFECLHGKLDPDFLDHLRQSHFWSHYINAGGTGSVRMRTYYDDLAALRLKMPPYEEQLAISEILNTAKRELHLIGDQIEVLNRQKRGLMQNLLTGEWRVRP